MLWCVSSSIVDSTFILFTSSVSGIDFLQWHHLQLPFFRDYLIHFYNTLSCCFDQDIILWTRGQRILKLQIFLIPFSWFLSVVIKLVLILVLIISSILPAFSTITTKSKLFLPSILIDFFHVVSNSCGSVLTSASVILRLLLWIVCCSLSCMKVFGKYSN